LSSAFDVAQGGFEGGNDVDYRAIQKRWGWFVVPLCMRSVQDYVIPIESTAQAADGFYLRRISRGSSIQLLGDKMVGVPKLPGSLVRDSAEALPLGEVKSVGKIGSQTTRTRNFVSERLARNFSAAEAPADMLLKLGRAKG
jgi:hypothetical protein